MKRVKTIASSHPHEPDYWNALVTAVLQNSMQLRNIMENHESAKNDAEFKQLYESLQCTSPYKVKYINDSCIISYQYYNKNQQSV